MLAQLCRQQLNTDALWCCLTQTVVMVMSLGFICFVTFLHIIGKVRPWFSICLGAVAEAFLGCGQSENSTLAEGACACRFAEYEDRGSKSSVAYMAAP